jgi:hypothetical protein
MPLSDDDLAAIGKLMDARMETVRRDGRRRFWVWMWIFIILTVASLVGSWFAVKKLKEQVDQQVTQINLEMSDAKLAYQRELAKNQQLQAERAQAEKAVAYDGTKTQAQHEAGLLGGMISLIGRKQAFEAKWKDADFSDPAQMEAYAEELNTIIVDGLNPLGQVVLRNTDPAHNTASERLLTTDGASEAATTPELSAEPEAPRLKTAPAEITSQDSAASPPAH